MREGIVIEQVSVEVVAARLRDGDADLVLLDCREDRELRIASLPGAHHIPMHQIPDRLAELDPRSEFVIFCHTGIRSMHVAAFLMERGFTRVTNMTGGIDAWSLRVDSGVPRY